MVLYGRGLPHPSTTRGIWLGFLIDIGHPAHVHFFRNAYDSLRQQGQDVVVTANDKDVTTDLLGAYGIPYTFRGRHSATTLGKAVRMPTNTLRLAKIAAQGDAQVLAGINNPYVAQASRLLGIPCVVFSDTERARLIGATTFPFATFICTPRRFAYDLGRKHIRYDGYHELAYLAPPYFNPDSAVPAQLAPRGEPYVLVRLVAWTTSHDLQLRSSQFFRTLANGGLSAISREARTWIVSERPLPRPLESYRYPLPPNTVLDALAGCAGYIGEGATMATEAAILGRPSIFVSSVRVGSMTEVEERFGLLRTIQDPEEAISLLRSWLADPSAGRRWRKRRRRLLGATIDVTDFIVRTLLNVGAPS